MEPIDTPTETPTMTPTMTPTVSPSVSPTPNNSSDNPTGTPSLSPSISPTTPTVTGAIGSEPSNNSRNGIYIILALALLIAVIIGLFCWIRRIRAEKAQKQEQETYDSHTTTHLSSVVASTDIPKPLNAIRSASTKHGTVYTNTDTIRQTATLDLDEDGVIGPKTSSLEDIKFQRQILQQKQQEIQAKLQALEMQELMSINVNELDSFPINASVHTKGAPSSSDIVIVGHTNYGGEGDMTINNNQIPSLPAGNTEFEGNATVEDNPDEHNRVDSMYNNNNINTKGGSFIDSDNDNNNDAMTTPGYDSIVVVNESAL
eukprot:CAMPEP_0114663346 /NCGR_PEP_ID=MMETSP0191-20121206/26733_1 /TAXON_ID=126664 /ORGANISM="Sorites sp." /LENGTH=315 /DNA_ID=CAMNT_0001902431 /DNA_START=760 /DNA_END=1707 /DNA_ORIENTATION=+